MPSLIPLHPHPKSAAPSGVGVSGALALGADGALRVTWRLTGRLHALRIAALEESRRLDELWRHTCVEAFVRAPSSLAYFEFNVSPSGAWNAYAFEGYRVGMRPLELARPPVLELARSSDHLEITAEFALGLIGPCDAGLTAVLESEGGELSYWAASHPSDRPDFHHADGFSLRVG